MTRDRRYKGEIISCYEMQDRIVSQGQTCLMVDVKSRIPTLDKHVQGFQDGELIVISGPTKNGKTLLAQTLTRNFARQQVYSLWFSFEVPARQFLSSFDQDDMPLFYLPDELEVNNIEWVEAKIMESFELYRTRVVFIDHLHYLFDMFQTKNPSLTIGTLVRRLKSLAVRKHFVIFLLCHTTKGSSEGDMLSFESIRDSSLISQESDTVFMIRRVDAVNTVLRVEFHRRTGVLRENVPLIKVGKYLEERRDM